MSFTFPDQFWHALVGVAFYALHRAVFSRRLTSARPCSPAVAKEGSIKKPDTEQDKPECGELANLEPDAEPESGDAAPLPARQRDVASPPGLHAKLLLGCVVLLGGISVMWFGPSLSAGSGDTAGAQNELHAVPAVAPRVMIAEQVQLPQDAPQILSDLLVADLAEEGHVTGGTPDGVMRTDSSTTQRDRVLSIAITRQGSEIGGVHNPEEFIRSAYYGTLQVGSPAEPFTVVFDTGSGHLIVPSTYCKTKTCRDRNRFRPRGSTTSRDINKDGSQVYLGEHRDQITVGFGTGTVTGVFVEDVVCLSDRDRESSTSFPNGSLDLALASNPSFGCTTMRLIAATGMSADPFDDFEFDGILGLGLSALSQTSEFNFLDVLAQASTGWRDFRMPAMFAVFLADSVGEESEINLGGMATEHLREDLAWSPVFEPEYGHWIVEILGIRIDNNPLDFCKAGCRAAVDTGTSLLAVPTDVFPELFTSLETAAQLAGHCFAHGPQLHIELKDFTVTLGPREYAQIEAEEEPLRQRLAPNNGTSGPLREWFDSSTTRSDLRCSPMLMTLDLEEPLGPKLFVLGEPVLRKYYTVYDAQTAQVGFGRARHQRATRREDMIMDDGWPWASATFGSTKTPSMFDIFRWRKERLWTLR